MKLLAQTNRRYLLVSLAALVLSSAALFMGIRSLFNHNVDERLTQLATEIVAYAAVHDTLPVFFQSTSAKLEVRRSIAPPIQTFGDTLILNEIEQEEEPYRRLRFGLKMRGVPYEVDLLQSAVETEDIVEMVLSLNFALLVLMSIVLYWAQRRLSERLWRPFYNTLEQLRHFQLAQSVPLKLGTTATDEFSELNTVLERLTEKTRQDYHALKRFTENASHEIQTPLSVIQAKLETLLQSDQLTDTQLADLHSTQRAAARLSRLQQSLLLLVKIENEQFPVQEAVDFKRLIVNKLDLLEDFISAKKLLLSADLSAVRKLANLFLAETLVGNLLGNAVKHNLPEAGWLHVELQEKYLRISNSCLALELPAGEFMERFRRGDHPTEGLGLGLAIAKEICEQYSWVLEVGFEHGVWITTVYFHPLQQIQ